MTDLLTHEMNSLTCCPQLHGDSHQQDQVLQSHLMEFLREHIAFQKKLTVFGLLSYRVDNGRKENYVKIRFTCYESDHQDDEDEEEEEEEERRGTKRTFSTPPAPETPTKRQCRRKACNPQQRLDQPAALGLETVPPPPPSSSPSPPLPSNMESSSESSGTANQPPPALPHVPFSTATSVVLLNPGPPQAPPPAAPAPTGFNVVLASPQQLLYALNPTTGQIHFQVPLSILPSGGGTTAIPSSSGQSSVTQLAPTSQPSLPSNVLSIINSIRGGRSGTVIAEPSPTSPPEKRSVLVIPSVSSVPPQPTPNEVDEDDGEEDDDEPPTIGQDETITSRLRSSSNMSPSQAGSSRRPYLTRTTTALLSSSASTGPESTLAAADDPSTSNEFMTASADSKIYHCRFCTKFFNRKFCRERHERLHTGVKPYLCELCSEKFIRLEDKKRHMRTFHPSELAGRLGLVEEEEEAEDTGLDLVE